MIIRSVLEEDKKKGLIVLRNIVDLEPYLKANHEEKKLIGKGFSKKHTLRKIGSIPIEFLLSLPRERQEAIMQDPKEIKKLLKEHPEFRCSEGEI